MSTLINSIKLWQIPKTVWGQVYAQKYQKLLERLKTIFQEHKKIVLANSLQVEDVVLTKALLELAQEYHDSVEIKIITLETGRLPSASLEFINIFEKHFNINIEKIFPNKSSVQEYIKAYGVNGFYESEELKKLCCWLRKVKPLFDELKKYNHVDCWISGQRREQSDTRTALLFIENTKLPEGFSLKKYNPLFDWTEAEIWAVVQKFQLPINNLYTRGYPSIGCEPCTRAVKIGDPIRSGRWWWLDKSQKECGLHLSTK